MPAKKKEQKVDEPVYVDEEGVFVHEAECARYKGSIRRLNLPSSSDAAGVVAAAAAGTTAATMAAAGAATTAAAGGGGSSTRSSMRATSGAAAVAVTAPHETSAIATTTSSAAHAQLPRYRHGVGTYTSPTLHYMGDWYEDAMHGHGRLRFVQSGCAYDGAFVYGKLEGKGVYTWPDGARYDGMWRDNRMHGEGTFTDADGNVWHGKFYNGTGPGLARLYDTHCTTTTPPPHD